MHNPTGFVLVTDTDYLNTLFTEFATPEDVTNFKLQKYFSQQLADKDDNKNKKLGNLKRPYFFTTDEFILKKGTLPNVKEDIQTSIGTYIFNMFCVSSIFGDLVPYVNPKQGVNDDIVGDLMQSIVDLQLEDKITGEQFAQFQDRFTFLGFKSTLWSPGISFEFIKVNPNVAKAKKDCIANWEKAVANGADPTTSYIDLVESPLLKIAKDSLKNDEAWPLYARGAKPKFTNVYKNCCVSMGPVYDPVTGNYKIAQNSFMEGIDNTMVDTYANIQIDAAYNRAVNTQDGGAKTKQIFSAMQSVKLNPNPESDCGTKMYIIKEINKGNIKKNLYRWIYDEVNSKWVKLTEENKTNFIGKKVKMRSPLFCLGNDYCAKCAGDYFYKLGLTNIGNAATRATSKLMNLSLKAMHDISLNTFEVDPTAYLKKMN